MRPLFRPILLARPTAATVSSNLRNIRQLRSNSKFFTPACTRYPLLQPRQVQLGQQIRWVSSGEKNTLGSSGNGSGGANDRTPPPHSPLGPEFKNLPSQQEFRRSEMSKRFSKAMEDLQIAIFTAGKKLNILTGYSEIESLKKSIENLEAAVKTSRIAVRTAKEDYQSAIGRRSASQREVNELLQRKHAWSSSDLERFTELYRSDHANQQAEVAAQEQLAVAERVADDVQAKLSSSILSRYHEEQIWSDKIRRASTWVTWGLMGFNVFLFVVVQLWLEPWKRRRLVGGFEEKVREVIQEEGLRNALLNLHVEPEAVVSQIIDLATAATEATSDTTTPVEAITEAGTEAIIDSEPVVLEDEIIHSTTTGEEEAPVEEIAIALNLAEEYEKKHIWEKDVIREVKKWLGYSNEKLHDMFSDRVISLKKAELTTALLESAAFGAFMVISLRQVDFTAKLLDSTAFGAFMAAIISMLWSR